MSENKSVKILLNVLVISCALAFFPAHANAAVTNGWEQNETVWSYYVDGVKTTGIASIEGQTYYFNDKGEMQTGWIVIDNKTYYFTGTGQMATGWRLTEGNWRYLDESGKMVTGMKVVEDKTYYFDENGYMHTGWLDLNGKKYYFKYTGSMTHGWLWIVDRWYYFTANGEMATGWLPWNGKWYYLNPQGQMYTGWLQYNDKWYYLYSGGEMASSTITPDRYRVGPDGVWDGKPQIIEPEVNAPSGVTLKEIAPNMVNIKWKPVSNADYYYCYWSYSMDKGYIAVKNMDGSIQKFNWQSNGYAINIDTGRTVYFKVTAVNDGVESQASAIVSNAPLNGAYFPLLTDVPMPANLVYYRSSLSQNGSMAVYYYSNTLLPASFINDYASLLQNSGWSFYSEDPASGGKKYFSKGSNILIISVEGTDTVITGNIH
ncbi:MAG: hypothetical protein AB9844_12250 [Clostridiaceae bacterium]